MIEEKPIRRKSAKYLAFNKRAHMQRVRRNFAQHRERIMAERQEIVWMANVLAKLVVCCPEKYQAA